MSNQKSAHSALYGDFKCSAIKILIFYIIFLNILFFFYIATKVFHRFSTNVSVNKSDTIPMPSHKDLETHFKDRNEYYSKFPIKKDNNVFIGNSLTEGFNVTEIFGNVKNRGIGGDNSVELLQRLPLIIENKPKKIFIEIGINDIGYWQLTNDSLLINYQKIITLIKANSSSTKIFIQSILPVSENNKKNPIYSHKNKDISFINQQLALICKRKSVQFIDLHQAFIVNGEMNPEYTVDGIHLNDKGYEVWVKMIHPYFYD